MCLGAGSGVGCIVWGRGQGLAVCVWGGVRGWLYVLGAGQGWLYVFGGGSGLAVCVLGAGSGVGRERSADSMAFMLYFIHNSSDEKPLCYFQRLLYCD